MPTLAKKFVLLPVVLFVIMLVTVSLWAGTAQGASLDVTKTDDTNDGVCDSDCSLREAISTGVAGDTIDVPAGIYTLTLGAQIAINKDLTLTGVGSGDTIIQAAAAPGVADFRVFNITGSNIDISSVTIRYGDLSLANGGGIRNASGTLTLTDTTISNNTAGIFGGGISNAGGTLLLTNSVVSDNASFNYGGGIINLSGGTLTLTNSTVSGNSAGGAGGGIYNESSGLTLIDSTISSNMASGFYTAGGGIYNAFDTLIVRNSVITDNKAIGTEGDGGGIASVGVSSVLILTDSTVSNNTANDDGGGIYTDTDKNGSIINTNISGNMSGLDSGTLSDGGGIRKGGPSELSLIDSTVSGNTTLGDGGGINNFLGTLTLVRSTITDNVAGIEGGGVHNGSSSDVLILTNTTISGNSANFGGGIENRSVLNMVNSIVSENIAEFDGGGVDNFFGNATLTNSTVSGNSATSDGGGISNEGTLTLAHSTISGNTATSEGGGIWNEGTLTLMDSTVSGNIAAEGFGDGGGIWNSGTLAVTSSTVSGNIAAVEGGGIYDIDGSVTLIGSTVTGNAAEAGGGISIASDTVELVNTMVAKNTAAFGLDCFGSPTSLGYNLIGDVSGCGFTATTGDLVGDDANPIDPLLGPLQDNGGPTFTHALLAGSPAVDSIPVADCNDIDGVPVATDQRGVSRPQGSACDIGAYELVPVVEATMFSAGLSGDEWVETDAIGRFRARLNEAGTELEYQVLVGRIRGVTAAHIHCAPFGESGGIGVTLFVGGPVDIRNGVLAGGSIAGPDVGNGCGWKSFDDVLAGLRSGDTYVNVHTEIWPDGEIRGQIEPLMP